MLNLQSSAEQVNVARSNIDLAEETLVQSRDRFSAGVTDTVEVVQSQEAVASAHEQYISSLYNYNYAKISLVRALGVGEAGSQGIFQRKVTMAEETSSRSVPEPDQRSPGSALGGPQPHAAPARTSNRRRNIVILIVSAWWLSAAFSSGAT